jgi:hypothetical protein
MGLRPSPGRPAMSSPPVAFTISSTRNLIIAFNGGAPRKRGG